MQVGTSRSGNVQALLSPIACSVMKDAPFPHLKAWKEHHWLEAQHQISLSIGLPTSCLSNWWGETTDVS
jgi:hypothetical protein